MSKSVLDNIVKSVGAKHGINNAQDLVNLAKSKSNDSLALGIFDNITNKIVQQELSSTSKFSGIYSLPTIFTGNRLIGNGVEYEHDYPMGTIYDYNANDYLPSVEGQVARFDRTPITQLISNPKQKCVKLTMTRALLLSKMVSVEKLEALVAQVVKSLENDMKLYLAHKAMVAITKHAYSKVIDDKSENAYLAWKNFGSRILESQSFRNDYVINQTKYANVGNTWEKDDKLIFMSPNVYATYKIGLKPVVFNNKEMAWDTFINPNNIFVLPNTQYINGSEDETTKGQVEWKNEPYIDDNTIIVIDKKSLAIKPQLEQYDSQYFANNMTTFYQKNYWYVLDVIEFTNGFVFKNSNLTKLPSEQQE